MSVPLVRNINEISYNKDPFNIDQQKILIDKIKENNFIYSNHNIDPLYNELIKIDNISLIAVSNISNTPRP